MTDEQLQRIHDIEYSCDSRAELAERIVGLEDENAKLREQGARLFDKTLDLTTENFKLRELVQYICDENYGDDWFMEEAAAIGIEAHY